MKSKRWGEEVEQTQREMLAFVNYFKNLHTKLTCELQVQQAIVQSYEDYVPVSENDVWRTLWLVYPFFKSNF